MNATVRDSSVVITLADGSQLLVQHLSDTQGPWVEVSARSERGGRWAPHPHWTWKPNTKELA